MRKKEKAVLVTLSQPPGKDPEAKEQLEELEFLAYTAGAKTHKKFIQKLNHPHPKYFLGSGKLNEVKEYIFREKIDMIIFNDELTPSQLKNLERELDNVKLLDRTNLILDIFASHAKTAQAKTQVELAQCEYLLPRLTRMWTHLSRQKGGIGTKGPGEKEIETDRRLINNKISRLKKKLNKIDRQNNTRRKNRGQKVRVALVGYTNTGKSTIMNLLSNSNSPEENRLFATLDTTVKKTVLNNIPFLLSDTVGFIRKLPHNLVESFKSTLDEVREADILVHVVDISHPNFEKQISVVNKTLHEIGADGKKTLMVFNKIDKLQENNGQHNPENNSSPNPQDLINQLELSWMNRENENAIFMSGTRGINHNTLLNNLLKIVTEAYRTFYPYYPLKIYQDSPGPPGQ